MVSGRADAAPKAEDTMRYIAILCAVLATAASPCEVSVRVTNGYGRSVHVASGPVNLTAEVRVPPVSDNRLLVVEWDYADEAASMFDAQETLDPFFRADGLDGAVGSAAVSLDGAAEQARHDRRMSNLSGGTYNVVATVYRDGARQQACGRAVTTVRVVGQHAGP